MVAILVTTLGILPILICTEHEKQAAGPPTVAAKGITRLAMAFLCNGQGDLDGLGAQGENDEMAGYVSRRAMYYFKSSGWSRCWCILRGKRLLFFADRGNSP